MDDYADRNVFEEDGEQSAGLTPLGGSSRIHLPLPETSQISTSSSLSFALGAGSPAISPYHQLPAIPPLLEGVYQIPQASSVKRKPIAPAEPMTPIVRQDPARVYNFLMAGTDSSGAFLVPKGRGGRKRGRMAASKRHFMDSGEAQRGEGEGDSGPAHIPEDIMVGLKKWYQEISTVSLLRTGYCQLQKDVIYAKFQENIQGSSTMFLEHELFGMYNDFIKRLRICAKIAVEADPWYSEINSDSRRDSPGLFSPAQANALRNTGDIDIYLTYYATGPPKSSLTRVTSALLLDPFFDGYVDKVLAGQNWYLLPSIFTLPWVLIQTEIALFTRIRKEIISITSPEPGLSDAESTVLLLASQSIEEWAKNGALNTVLENLRLSTCGLE